MSPSKILIVEDEAIIAEDLASYLKKMGYVVSDIVASGEDAIAVARADHPNLVLMDIKLQGKMDGITAAKQIHTELKTPIVYLTAYADDNILQRLKLSGSFGYLLKPFQERELWATIEIALLRHQAELETQQVLTTTKTLCQEAQTNSERKSQYLSMVSHELRNPLTNIKAWAQLLERYGSSWPLERQQQSLQRIQIAANQMNQLLEDVLTLGRTEVGKLQFTRLPFDLVSFCQKLLQSLQFTAGECYRLTFNYQGDWRKVCLDETILEYLLNNLLSNAIKYSPEGGEISLALVFLESEICFRVRDQGIGIPQKDLPQLFEPFQRATNVGNISGTGLGLVIVKRAVELHGGFIEVQSQERQGTTFTVRLPC